MTDDTVGGPPEQVAVIVIGAGQAGLAAAHHLARLGLVPGEDLVVLDANAEPGGAWQHRWDSLTMGQVNGIFDLPGMALPPPPSTMRASEALPDYFAAFEDRFDLQVRRPVTVAGVRDVDGRWLEVDTDRGTLWARGIVNATGTWTQPHWPTVPGQWTFAGRQFHTATWPGPDDLAGERVVVVGGGVSAIGHLRDLADVATTRWVTRRPPRWRDEPFTTEWGRDVVARVDARVRAGKRPKSVVAETGLWMTPELARLRGRGILDRFPMFDRITPEAVVWDDAHADEEVDRFPADVILWATGFRWALRHLAPLGLRTPDGGIVMDGTRVVDEPRVHLVGYGPSASTVGANRAGRVAARELLDGLAARR